MNRQMLWSVCWAAWILEVQVIMFLLCGVKLRSCDICANLHLPRFLKFTRKKKAQQNAPRSMKQSWPKNLLLRPQRNNYTILPDSGLLTVPRLRNCLHEDVQGLTKQHQYHLTSWQKMTNQESGHHPSLVVVLHIWCEATLITNIASLEWTGSSFQTACNGDSKAVH